MKLWSNLKIWSQRLNWIGQKQVYVCFILQSSYKFLLCRATCGHLRQTFSNISKSTDSHKTNQKLHRRDLGDFFFKKNWLCREPYVWSSQGRTWSDWCWNLSLIVDCEIGNSFIKLADYSVMGWVVLAWKKLSKHSRIKWVSQLCTVLYKCSTLDCFFLLYDRNSWDFFYLCDHKGK